MLSGVKSTQKSTVNIIVSTREKGGQNWKRQQLISQLWNLDRTKIK